MYSAHRVAFVLHTGIDPVGLLVCHHCVLRSATSVAPLQESGFMAKGKKDPTDYKALAVKLQASSRLEDATATAEWVATLIEVRRHLHSLRLRDEADTITPDERRAVSTLMRARDTALVRMGVGGLKKKGGGRL